jgi:ribosome-binding protein aMBF1 (putative translation factor)
MAPSVGELTSTGTAAQSDLRATPVPASTVARSTRGRRPELAAVDITSDLGASALADEHSCMATSPSHAQVGKWLKDTREALGMTQVTFARRVNKNASFIAKTETGERRLDITEFVELAEALGTKPAKLLERLMTYFE